MKTSHILAGLMVAAATMAPSAYAQSERPVRPAESYGQWGAKPDAAPQRPADSFGQHGGRPADSYGQRGGRPAESIGKTGGRPAGVWHPRGR